MCGIAAIFAYNSAAPAVNEGELLSIRDCMTARGPDGCGSWNGFNRRVGLAHRRLSIIDVSAAGAQPMLLPDRELAVVFNGEIYNYQELRSALEQHGCKFRSTSDTEVLLHLYAQRGEAMVDALRGMYAFAIWDGRKKGLFMARDPYGIKPLYLADNGKTLRAASQVKALLAGGKVDTAPDPAGHVGFFLWGHMPSPCTLYRGVRSLPAGATLWVDADGTKRERTFCTVTQILAQAEQADGSWKTGAGGQKSEVRSQRSVVSSPSSRSLLSAALRDSVAQHLVSDVPVGMFLSSGLDSTTVASLAAEHKGALRTVTLGFDEFRGTPNDEAPLAEQMARQLGAQHQTIWIARSDFAAHVERLFAAMDQPSTDGVNTYFVSLAAARTSLKVALSGLGGDELFGGYPSFRQLPRTVGAFGWLGAPNPFGRSVRILAAPLLKRQTSPKYAGLLEYGGSYPGAYLLRRGMFMPWELPEILDADLVRQGWAELQPLARLEETLDALTNDRLKVIALESCWYMRNQLLRDSDWAGMAHSLEIRVPLVDAALLRRLAPLLASDSPPTKQDMAQTPISHLPSSILNRPKTGFSIPVREWLMEATPNSELRTPESAERGLRGWAKEVYSRFPGACLSEARSRRKAVGSGQWAEDRGRWAGGGGRRTESGSPTTGHRPPTHRPPSAVHRRILVLVSDAFGGRGGIAKFNRDLLTALATNSGCTGILAVPRLMPDSPSPLPDKLTYATEAIGGKLRFASTTLKATLANSQFELIVCGHIYLLPMAFLARAILQFRRMVGNWRSLGSHKAANSSRRIPIVLIIHGVEAWEPTRKPLVNLLAGRVDRFVAVSELTKQRFLSWSGLAPEKGSILHNCVDLSKFTPGPKRQDLLKRYRMEDRTILLTLGRLASEERYKGFDEVMEVLPELAKELPNVSYLIVGDGGDRERLEEKAIRLGVRDRVVFAGYIPEEEKADHFRLADAYVMPSRGEGFGIVYLEALACGIPVVGSKVDGSRDALRNGELGLLVDPAKPEQIVRAVKEALRKQRGAVLDGLACFSYPSFERECHRLIELVLR